MVVCLTTVSAISVMTAMSHACRAQGTTRSEGSVQIRAYLQHRRREQLRKVRVVLGEQAPNDVDRSGMQYRAGGCVAACITT